MTYAKFEQKHTDDERWIVAGSDAFAVHVAAIVYCDRQLTDGRISDAMARRVSLAVPPERTPEAVAVLVQQGFWRATGGGYQIEKYDEHAFPAEQIEATRARWSRDKERKRLHGNGNHSKCKDPTYCPAIRPQGSTVESAVESTGGGSHLYQTQPDQTRPDRRKGRSESGEGTGGSTASGGSAASSPAPPSQPQHEVPVWAAGPPPGAVIHVNGVEVKPKS